MYGRFLSSSSAVVHVRQQENITIAPASSNCDTGVLTFHLHPGTRAPVADGTYHGTAANGEPVQIRVIQGGRMIAGAAHGAVLIPSVQVGAWTTTCDSSGSCTSTANNSDACARTMQDSAWIDTSGQFNLPPPDSTDPGVSGSFSGTSVSGTLTYSGSSAGCSTTFTARL